MIVDLWNRFALSIEDCRLKIEDLMKSLRSVFLIKIGRIPSIFNLHSSLFNPKCIPDSLETGKQLIKGIEL